jgi:hypothetical protein
MIQKLVKKYFSLVLTMGDIGSLASPMDDMSPNRFLNSFQTKPFSNVHNS